MTILRMNMKKHLALALGLIALVTSACSDTRDGSSLERAAAAPAAHFAAADHMVAQKASNPYLALSHDFRIRHAENAIRERFNATVALCGQENFFDCTLIHASLHEDRQYPNATIQLRIRNQGLTELVTAATAGGAVVSQVSRAEDLTEAVTDTETRLEMLRSYRERLQALETRAQDDIDALIKVSSELARVQSDIEHMQGNRNNLQRRLDLDLVNLYFYTDAEDDYLSPLSESLDNFVYNLFSGASGLITTLAVTLPWALALLLLCSLVRWLWLRRRG